MRLDVTSDTFRLRFEVLIISRSEDVGMRNILDPCFYIRSGHAQNFLYPTTLYFSCKRTRVRVVRDDPDRMEPASCLSVGKTPGNIPGLLNYQKGQ